MEDKDYKLEEREDITYDLKIETTLCNGKETDSFIHGDIHLWIEATRILLTERIPDEYQFQDKYDCVCYNCNTEFFFKPSLLMIHGINHGYSICLKCRAELNLRINLNHGIGISLPPQEFLLKDFGSL